MQYRGGDIPEGINVTPTHPLKEFAILVGASIALVLLLFWILGEIASRLVVHLPLAYEMKLGKWYENAFKSEVTDQKLREPTAYLQKTLDQLVAKSANSTFPYKVEIHCSKQINAFALPGGRIVILSELLKNLKTKEELQMLLGHELGHHFHRDHLRGLGRALALMVPLMALGIADESGIAQGLGNLTNNLLLLHHSRAAEEAADDLGLQLLKRVSKHPAAGIVLFDDLQIKPNIANELPSFILTHPKIEERRKRLQEQFSASQLKTNGTPLPKQLFTKICD